MLQIISGKFYQNKEIHNNPTQMFLYSNANIENEFEIVGIKIKQVDNIDNIYKYSINFDNKIEQQSGNFSIVNAWSDVVLFQVKNVLTFYFDSFWDEEEYVVKKMCKERIKKGSRMEYVPANYVRSILDKERKVDEKRILEEKENVSNLIALSREDYVTVITCIKTYCASVRLLETDPNLAYSMLVFALESLSQSYDKYEPKWEDYDENIKGKLEKKFKMMDETLAEEIKNILLKNAHLKLSKRFLHFILNYLNDDFYFAKDISNKIQRDDVERALKNAYNIRSRYAHALKLIIDQSAVDNISKVSDYFRNNREPYLTYSGLLRVMKYVVIEFVGQKEKVERESIDWQKGLPGIIDVKLGPEFWMSKNESSKCEGASARLQEYIEGLMEKKAYDITDVMKTYIENFEHVKEESKRSIFALCILWNATVKHDSEKKKYYNDFIEKHISRLNVCCIQNMVLLAIPFKGNYEFEWKESEEEIEKIILEYIRNRKKETSFMFPNIIETIIYLRIAEKFSCVERQIFWIEKAKYNSSNNPKVLKIILEDSTISEKIDAICEYM